MSVRDGVTAGTGTSGSPAGPRRRRDALLGLPGWAAPADGTESRLAAIVAAVLDLDAVGADDDYFALGGTSLQAAAIFDRIHQELGRRMPLATLYRSPTVRSLASAIDRASSGGQPNPGTAGRQPPDIGCVVPIREGAGRAPLFIAPGLGGDVVGLAYVARELPVGRAVYALRSVGLLDGEEPLTAMPAIAGAFIRDMRRVQARGPYHLFGVCWGGLVMLEIAQQLRAAGDAVGLLALLDPPPVTSGGGPAEAASPPGPAPNASRFIADRLQLYRHSLANKPVREWPAYLGGRLANLVDVVRRRDVFRGDPTEFLRWRVRQANLHAVHGYRPAPFDGDACLLFTAQRGDGASRAGRDWWLAHFRAAGREIYVPGRDSGDAIGPERAGAVAAVLAALLA